MSLLSDTIDYDWQEKAICRGIEVGRFYPSENEPIDPELSALCSTCPVQQKCLNHAILYEQYGYWGGTTERQRVTIRKQSGIVCNRPESLHTKSVKSERERLEKIRPKIQGRGRKPAACGTRSGYNAHLRKKETPCERCKFAQCESVKEFKLEKKEKESE